MAHAPINVMPIGTLSGFEILIKVPNTQKADASRQILVIGLFFTYTTSK